MSSSSWKSVLLPPLFALALYLLITYILLPLYQRYARTWGSRYTPLGSSNSDNSQPSDAAAHLFDEFRTRVSDLLGRARSDSLNGEVGRFLGDEELEEGVYGGGGLGNNRGRRDGGDVGSGGEGDGAEESGRRLGRELEGGFMDDSSDEEEGERRRVRGVLGLRGG